MRSKRSTARAVLQTKVVLNNGVIVEIKILEIPNDERFPDGFKYSLFAIYDGKVLVGYDNHHPKGHHRHIGVQEFEYHFTTIKKLRNDFKADLEVQMIREGLQ